MASAFKLYPGFARFPKIRVPYFGVLRIRIPNIGLAATSGFWAHKERDGSLRHALDVQSQAEPGMSST